MISKAILLFLLGTAMASELFMKKLQSPYEVAVVPYKSSGCPTAADWAPLICKFLQTNMDMYYKPQLIGPSTYIPPLVVQKCETPEIKVDLELPAHIEGKKPVLIPRPPELPPLTIQKFPVPVIVEELPKKVNEPSGIPEMQLIHIPAAPQLPALAMPAIPRLFEQPEPYFFKEAIPEIDYNGIDEKPMVIPQPPELPEFTMPELPVHVEIPSGPVLPVMDIPAPHMIAEKPTEELRWNEKVTPEIDYNFVKFEPVSIPQPPELPDFVMPELPAIPTYFENQPIAYSPIQAEYKPLAILPVAPELPPTKLPEFPVSVEIPSGPVLPPGDLLQPIVVVDQPSEEPCLKEDTPKFDSQYNHIVIPQLPELPEFVMPQLPTLSFEQEPMKTYYEPLAPLPAAPELLAASLPELPLNFVIPSASVLPAMDIPSSPKFDEQPLPEIDYNMINRAPISIPAPPELPGFVMPELPLIYEQEPAKTYYEPIAPLPAAPELPVANLQYFPMNVEIPAAPALPDIDIPSPTMAEEQPLPEIDYNMIYRAPISIPAPPELPVFVMPELPLNFEQKPIKTYYEPIAPLPAALELPAANLQDIPMNVEIPAAPALPANDIPSPTMAEEQPLPEIDCNMIYRAPISIPAPPELPAFVMLELPLNFEQKPIKTYYEPIAPLPAAPELPAANLPESPFNIEVPADPALPAIEIPSPTMDEEQPLPGMNYNMIYRTPTSIPVPPELPAFKMPELPFKIEEPPTVALTPKLPSASKLFEFKPNVPAILPTFINKPCESSGKLEMEFDSMLNPYFQRYFNENVKESHNIMIPMKPMNQEYVHSPCVYNLVMQHVLPNIASDHFRSLEKVKALTPTLLPCA